MTSGYSQTPLAKELSLRDGQHVWFDGMPENVQDEIGEYALDLLFVTNPEEGPDASHIFVTDSAVMRTKLQNLRGHMARDGHIWVSWPKVGSTISTDITEDLIRDMALPLGLVDTKVIDVDDAWSGMKLVIRKELR